MELKDFLDSEVVLALIIIATMVFGALVGPAAYDLVTYSRAERNFDEMIRWSKNHRQWLKENGYPTRVCCDYTALVVRDAYRRYHDISRENFAVEVPS